jgi:hypothetical protein
MNTAERRHVLVVASQCRNMKHLDRLREAATNLHNAFLDQDVGACEPGLPGSESLLYGELPIREIEDNVRAAIDYAAKMGATLVLALLGHGFNPGTDPTLYFMGRDSKLEVRNKAVNVVELLINAADRSGIKDVIGIIDTCSAAGALPRAAELVPHQATFARSMMRRSRSS